MHLLGFRLFAAETLPGDSQPRITGNGNLATLWCETYGGQMGVSIICCPYLAEPGTLAPRLMWRGTHRQRPTGENVRARCYA